MRIGFGILLVLTLSGPALASGDAAPFVAGDEVAAQEIVHTLPDATRVRDTTPSSRIPGPEAEADLPVLHPGGDPLFHLDDDAADLFSQRRSFTPRRGRHGCGNLRDARCIAVAGPRLGGAPRHDFEKRPACSVRANGTPSHAEGVARARVFEQQAPLLLAIPIDGVKTRPIERASTC